MADWMNQLVNAVAEAEAADALPQEEVPTAGEKKAYTATTQVFFCN